MDLRDIVLGIRALMDRVQGGLLWPPSSWLRFGGLCSQALASEESGFYFSSDAWDFRLWHTWHWEHWLCMGPTETLLQASPFLPTPAGFNCTWTIFGQQPCYTHCLTVNIALYKRFTFGRFWDTSAAGTQGLQLTTEETEVDWAARQPALGHGQPDCLLNLLLCHTQDALSLPLNNGTVLLLWVSLGI
jgi:hypothetical protein